MHTANLERSHQNMISTKISTAWAWHWEGRGKSYLFQSPKNSLKLGTVAYTYNPALKIQRQEDDHKFKANLIYPGGMNE